MALACSAPARTQGPMPRLRLLCLPLSPLLQATAAMRTHASSLPTRGRSPCSTLLLLFCLGLSLSVLLLFARAQSSGAVVPDPSMDNRAPTSLLPTPIVATWVRLQPVSGEADGALPAPRCDHSFRSLREASRLAGLSAATVATLESKALLFGGHQDAAFSDSWLLDLDPALDAPVWRRLAYSNPSAALARWGQPLTFRASRDGRLLADVFGGLTGTGEAYLPSIDSLDLVWGTWQSFGSVPGEGDTATPFARAYTEWYTLPTGFGTGNLSESDSGVRFLLGGAGALDGVRFGPQDKDYADQWLYTPANNSWARFGRFDCTQWTKTCADARLLSDVLNEYANLSAQQPPLDFSAAGFLRPSEVYPALQRIVDGIEAAHLRPDSLQDDPASCKMACTTFEAAVVLDANNATISFTEPIEGTRGAVMHGKLYEFGGYKCAEGGVQKTGGEACFHRSMRILDFASMQWREVAPPALDGPLAAFRPFWPSARAYNTIGALPSRNLVLVAGGAFQDASGVLYYLNDQFAFDAALDQFVPFDVKGNPPPIAWSMGGSVHSSSAAGGDGDFLVHGGCDAVNYFDHLFALRVGLSVKAENMYASGSGLSQAVAGVQASFTMQARELVTLAGGEAVFGNNASYGTGLDITVQLISSGGSGNGAAGAAGGGGVTLLQARVEEEGEGLYTVSYTAYAGARFQLYILFDSVANIPGSPFTVLLAPAALSAPSMTVATGWGTNYTVRGERGEIVLQLQDAYANPLRDSQAFFADASAPLRFVDTIHNASLEFDVRIEVLGDDGAHSDPAASRALNHGDGKFSVSYAVPEDASAYLLHVQLNGEPVASSPFSVTALEKIRLSRSVVLAFAILATVGVIICLFCAGLVVWFRHETVIRSSSPNYLMLLIAGSVMSTLSVFFLLSESDAACQAFHTLLSVGLVTSMAALLAKSARVARIFNATKLKQLTGLSDARMMIPTGAAILAMLLINLLWIGVDPMRSESRPSSSSQFSSILSFQACSSKTGNAWLGVMLAFCSLMLLYGVYLVFQTGHVPEQFNEAKLITATVYNIFFCAVVVVPLLFFLGNTSEFLDGRVVITALVILWCAAFQVAALITPKMWLLFRVRKLLVAVEGGTNDTQLSVTTPGKSVGVADVAATAGVRKSHPQRLHLRTDSHAVRSNPLHDQSSCDDLGEDHGASFQDPATAVARVSAPSRRSVSNFALPPPHSPSARRTPQPYPTFVVPPKRHSVRRDSMRMDSARRNSIRHSPALPPISPVDDAEHPSAVESANARGSARRYETTLGVDERHSPASLELTRTISASTPTARQRTVASRTSPSLTASTQQHQSPPLSPVLLPKLHVHVVSSQGQRMAAVVAEDVNIVIAIPLQEEAKEETPSQVPASAEPVPVVAAAHTPPPSIPRVLSADAASSLEAKKTIKIHNRHTA